MSHIFTRRASGLYAPDREPIIVSPFQFQLHGEIEARLYRAKSGTLLNHWRFPNLLVNTLLDALGTNAVGFPGVGLEVDSTNWFAAGTTATAPAVTDTTLVAEIGAGGRAATSIINAFYVAGSPDYCLLQRRATFATTQANGTIAEFGWFSASTVGSLRARAIPKDAAGNPITIIKTSATTLVVDWSVKVRYIQADIVLTRNVSGVPYTMTARAIGANATNPASYFFISRGPNWAASLGARGSVLAARTSSSGVGSAVTGVASAYVPGSYQREMTFTTIVMSAIAFLTNCGGTSSDNYACIQIGFAPSLPAGQPLKVTVSWVPV